MKTELWATIRRLFEIEKLSKSAIAKHLGIHRWTVRRALKSNEGPPEDNLTRLWKPGKLEPYKPYLQERIKKYPALSGIKLMKEIQEQGYGGQKSILRMYLKTIRPQTPTAFLRLETLPGEFAQVDWANVGTLTIGNAKRKLSCFVMVLSYSRMMYVEFTLSQRLEDFMECHRNALEFFGGVPWKINYDNLKSVVIQRVGQQIQFQTRFMQMAGFYLFEAVPCGVRKPNEKGKVERGIGYVRTSFLSGYEVRSLSELQRDAATWRDQVANVRIHGTTRERPLDRFESEKEKLHPLPSREIDCSIIETVDASRQALVHFDVNRYSVPYCYAGRTLTLKADRNSIEIYDESKRVAKHARCYEKFRVIENPDHYKGLLAERKKAKGSKLVQYFLALAPECAAYLKGLMAGELNVASHMEKIKNLTERYGKAEVMSALLHALKFNAFGADYIERIVNQQRAARNLEEPQPIELHKKPHWSKVTVEETDLSLYDDLFE